MARYAIGDVHGCLATLRALVATLQVEPGRDEVWLLGDLVNRGPDSLGVLRYARDHAPAVRTVLGNHDLVLLAALLGVRALRPHDPLQQVLDAPDREALFGWLRHQPLAVEAGGHLLVHAGVPPDWTLDEVMRRARDAEALLRGPDAAAVFFAWLHKRPSQAGRAPPVPRDAAASAAIYRAASTLEALTCLRVVDGSGRPRYAFKGAEDKIPRGQRAWFRAPHRALGRMPVAFGHWAALGLQVEGPVRGLDTGCAYGGPLTALCLDEDRLVHEPNREAAAPARIHGARGRPPR